MEQKTFRQYFNDNMRALGLPVPDSLFGTATTATATIKTMSDLILKFGPRVTLMELVQTSPSLAVGASEFATVGTALFASLYVGACIGSLAVATGQSASGGYSISDMFTVADTSGVERGAWMHDSFQKVHKAQTAKRPISTH